MDNIENYIRELVNKLDLPNSKKIDLKLEFADHIVSLRDEYITNGLPEIEATNLAIKSFGNNYKISNIFNAIINKNIKKVSIFLFLVYLLPLLLRLNYITWFDLEATRFSFYNLIPFYTLYHIINALFINGLTAYHIDLFSSILWFIPIGILIPLSLNSLNSFKSTIKIYGILVLTLQTVKFILGIGVGNIDYALIHLIGCVIGYSLIKIISRISEVKRILYSSDVNL